MYLSSNPVKIYYCSEMAKCEEILADFKRYKELLFKLSPPEWQEAHRTKNKKDKGNLKTKGISIVTTSQDAVFNDVIWSKQLFYTCVAGIIKQNVLTDLDIKVSSPGGETLSKEDSSLSQTQSDTQ